MKPSIVTGNTKKFAELSQALKQYNIDTVHVSADIDELQSNDARIIIADKVRKAHEQIGGPVLVDDSGIYFEQYGNFPGPLSKYVFLGIGYEGLFRLVKPGDRAWFHCFIAYMDDDLEEPMIFDAKYGGVITNDFERDETNEMPFAPMFIPDGENKPMAEMTSEEREHDHRHKAIHAFVDWYTKNRSRSS